MKHVELISDYITDGTDFQYFDNTGTIVRCKGCKHFYADAECGQACELTEMRVEADDYCSFAERKEDDDE